MSPGELETIEALRARLDALDRALLETLAGRLEISDRIGALKARAGLAVLQPERERELLAQRHQQALELGLDPVRVRALYELLLAWSRAAQGERE